MNTDKPRDNQPERSTDYDELLKRIRQRREEIRLREGLLSDSAKLTREDRDR